MPIGSDTYAYRGRLPHLINRGKTYFVTFHACRGLGLSPRAREIALNCCIHDHELLCWVDCCVVMPDHVHLLVIPHDDIVLSRVMARIKGASVHKINRIMGRTGHLWQRESFDHILRSDEKLAKVREYICMNPVRAGLATSPDDYPWLWRSWMLDGTEDGGRSGRRYT